MSRVSVLVPLLRVHVTPPVTTHMNLQVRDLSAEVLATRDVVALLARRFRHVVGGLRHWGVPYWGSD